jgi:uncharacterized protein YoxC
VTEPTEDNSRNHRSYGPLTKILVAVAVFLSVCCGVLAYAVTEQGDKIEAQGRQISTLEDQTEAIAKETKHLSEIADQITADDPEQDARLAEVFRQIEEICKATVNDCLAPTEGE